MAYERRSFPGGAISTTIPTGMASGDSSFTLAAATNWTVTNNFFVVVDRGLATEEKIKCSGISSLVVTVAASGRGADGTAAVGHSAGCNVQICHVAQDDDEANQVVAAVLGQSGAAKGDIPYLLSAAGPNTLSRLGIGTTAQVIGVSSGVPVWQALTATQLGGAFTAKGDLFGGTGSGTGAILGVGANNTILVADSTQTDGFKWVAPGTVPVISTQQAGTSYTLVLADQGTVVETTNASAVALTVPPNSTAAFPVGTIIEIFQDGAGQVTLTAGAGVTFRSDSAKVKTAAQYASVSIRQRAANEWVLAGDLA